jgi:hypothetical protein
LVSAPKRSKSMGPKRNIIVAGCSASPLPSSRKRGAGLLQRIHVARRIDQHTRAQLKHTALGEHAQSGNAPFVAFDIQQIGMQKGPHAGLGHHVVEHQLEDFGRVFDAVHVMAGRHHEALVRARRAIAPQPRDHFVGQPCHHRRPLPVCQLLNCATAPAVALPPRKP